MNEILNVKLGETKGITMITLVVTIVILLILAGITIGTITGNNGLIGKAGDAKKEHEIASWEERIDTAIIQVEGSKRNPNIDDVIQGLIDKEIISSESQVNKETGLITTNSPVYEISGKLDDYTGVTAKTIANAENKEDYYGKYVNYNPLNGASTRWRIFHSDGQNIYLIAEEYVENVYIPKTKYGTQLNQGNDKYALKWDIVRNEYIGSKDIESRNAALKWLNFVKQYPDSNIDSMKMTAYMVDTKIWSEFTNEYSEYAIGGPTIELYIESFNSIHVNKIDFMISETGYLLKWSSEEEYGITVNDLPKEDLYVPKSAGYTNSFYCAGPISHYSNWMVCQIRTEAAISATGPNSNKTGFKPVVCLKSDVRLQKQDNGNYAIK